VQSSTDRNVCLLFSAFGDLAIAALHVAIVVIGAPGYLYFGAASLALPAQRGELWPAALTLAIALVFLAWGCYALAGAGQIPRLPLLRSALVVIASLYLLRGLILIPDIVRLAAGAGYPVRQAVFSASALLLGITHALGTARLRRQAPTPPGREA
jgi:hypothetical protein